MFHDVLTRLQWLAIPRGMVSPDRNYRSILRDEMEARYQRNPRYSMRAFARDLGVSPSRISEILAGKKGLSRANALKIARKLGYSDHEAELFVALVDSVHGRGTIAKEKAIARISAATAAPEFSELQQDAFHVIADWHHYAILELTYVEGFKSDPRWIGDRLGIPFISAQLAIDRLKRLGLLEEHRGKLAASEAFTASTSGIPSGSLKKHHEQILERAKSAIYEQALEARDLSAMTMAIDDARIPEAKELIKNFRREFAKLMDRSKKRNRVYCLSVQFFGLDRVKGEGK